MQIGRDLYSDQLLKGFPVVALKGAAEASPATPLNL